MRGRSRAGSGAAPAPLSPSVPPGAAGGGWSGGGRGVSDAEVAGVSQRWNTALVNGLCLSAL